MFAEVIADSMETMLTDGKVIEKLQMLQAKDKKLFDKIKEAIAELVRKIKNAYKNIKAESLEGQIVSDMLDEIEMIQQLFVDAIVDASENFKNVEAYSSESASKNNEVRYSLNERFSSQIDSWDRKTIGFSFVVGTTSKSFMQKSRNCTRSVSSARSNVGILPYGVKFKCKMQSAKCKVLGGLRPHLF